MKAAIYRLGEYKIIKSGIGEMTWEAHFSFGDFQEGRCFTKGSILFIGPAENHRNGFLKGEFLDELRKHPQWLLTKFYCTGVGVHHCKNGKSATKEEMMLWTLDRGHGDDFNVHPENSNTFSNSISTGKVTEDAVYRLKQYEITAKTDGQIIWKTNSGLNTIVVGNCFILENILFIGSQLYERFNLSKGQFLANLRQLPKWDQTEYFCKRLSLHESKTGKKVQEGRKRWPHESTATNEQDARNEYGTRSEYKIPNGAHRGIFFARLSAIWGSLSNQAGGRGEHDGIRRFKFIKSYISKSITIFRASYVTNMKRITYVIAHILLKIGYFFVLMIGYLKKYYSRKK